MTPTYREKLLESHKIVVDGMETDREIVAEMEKDDIENYIDGECSDCGMEYPSVELMDGECMKCFANAS